MNLFRRRVLIAALGLNLILWVLKALQWTQEFDIWGLSIMAMTRNSFLTTLATAATRCLNFWPTVIFAGVLLIAVRMVSGTRSMYSYAILVFGTLVLGEYAKHILKLPRPEIVPRLIHASGYTFPSGHSIRVAGLILGAYFILNRSFEQRVRKWILVLSLLAIGLVCWSRVYLGVHYPLDVVGGALLGSTWALFLARELIRTSGEARLERG